MYVFDTMIFSQLFDYYYRDQFPSLWARFELLVKEGKVTSAREVKKELENHANNKFKNEIAGLQQLFTEPTSDEKRFVTRIYAEPRFLNQFPTRHLLKGGAYADPFVIARAAVHNGTVVTNESEFKGGTKIPNLCKHFQIDCVDFQGFMRRENWSF